MLDNKSIQEFKDCLNRSTFFSTDVSLCKLQTSSQTNQNSLLRIVHSKQLNSDCRTYCENLKIKKKQKSKQLVKALQNNIKARASLERVQLDAALYKHDFIKAYHTKKFKLEHDFLMNNRRSDQKSHLKQAFDKSQRLRFDRQFTFLSRKEGHEKKIENIRYQIDQQKKQFRQTWRLSEDKMKKQMRQTNERIRKAKQQNAERRKNLSDLSATKSKFNYLSKINDQMLAIRQFQDQLQQIQSDKYYSRAKIQHANTFFIRNP